MIRLAHLSDLHFGAVAPGDAERLLASLEAARPDYVVVTGDLTMRGRHREFVAAAAFLAQLPGIVVVVPGNHDVPALNLLDRFARPFHRFRRHVHDEVEPWHLDGEVAIAGVNSARAAGWHWNWSHGRLSRQQVRRSAERLARAPAPFKVVGLHHPVLRSGGAAGSRLVGGASFALAAWAEAQVDVVLQGHAHLPRQQLLPAAGRTLLALQSGSSLGVRLRGEAGAYNLLDWHAEGQLVVEVHARETDYAAVVRRAFGRGTDGWSARSPSQRA